MKNEEPAALPADLIPYLMAAEELDDEAAAKEPTETEDEQLEALRALVKDTLLAGADPEFVDAILYGDEEGEEDADHFDHDSLLDQAELDAANAKAVGEIYAHLLSRTPEHDFDPSLKRVREVLDILGDPQQAYPSIHVAGTNGKTSTTKIAAALLHGFGLRAGSFTSPHLQDVRERIQINGEPWSQARFVAAWQDVLPYIEMVDMQAAEKQEPQISYFEALTITALAGFADEPVDVAVVETGLGGRLDATNVLDAGVCVITPISLDHQDYLGTTLAEIAAEKAAIIKDKSIVVVAEQEPQALEVILARAAETDSVVWLEGRDWQVSARQMGVGGQMLDVRTPTGTYEGLFLPLHGEHQAHNSAAALVAAEAMMGGKALPAEVVEEGFMQVRSPGRLELIRRSPSIVVDGAHNPVGVAAMVAGLEEAFHFGYTVGVFSAMQDKNIEAMLVEAEPAIDHLVLTDMGSARGASMQDLKEIADDVFGDDRVSVEEELPAAIDKATELADAPADTTITRGIIVFGSLTLVGEVTQLVGRQ